jgi:ankyrin repeat protein
MSALRSLSFSSQPDVRATDRDLPALPDETQSVWAVPVGGSVPEGFVDFHQHNADLPVALLSTNPHVCVRSGSREEAEMRQAFEALSRADRSENAVVAQFLHGSDREVFKALVTLVRFGVLDIRHDASRAPTEGFLKANSVLDEMACGGVEPDPANANGISLFERFRALRSAGVDLGAPGPDKGMQPPLALAIREKNLPVVVALLKNGVDPSRCPGMDNSPLMLAQEVRSPEIFNALLEHNADPHVLVSSYSVQGERLAPIHLAAQKRTDGLREINSLLSHGAHVNLQSDRGLTPFQCAIIKHQFANAALLRDNGADPDIFDFLGQTALHKACEDGDIAAIQGCVRLGANSNLRTRDGRTPLYLAILSGADRRAIAELLTAGAHVNADNRVIQNMAVDSFSWIRTETRRPALHLVGDYELREMPLGIDLAYLADIARLLIDHGADKAQRDLRNGDTPLHVAARRGNLPVVKVLLEYGRQRAQVSPRNKRNETPIECAARQGHHHVCHYLREKGAGWVRVRNLTSYGIGGGA